MEREGGHLTPSSLGEASRLKRKEVLLNMFGFRTVGNVEGRREQMRKLEQMNVRSFSRVLLSFSL